ncbi:MAG: hypothetical protein M0Z84_05935 [Gammaproteobacteria bacterium]|nr:hypothetical protein [Gammaproteobacteria bacterium]
MFTLVTVRKTLSRNTFIALCMLSGKAAATPVITGVAAPGGLMNGATLTITGSGFGTKTPAAPYLWADFGEGNINPSPLGQDHSWSAIQNMVYSAAGGPDNGPYAQGTPQSGSGVYWTLMLSPPYNSSTGVWGFTWNDLSAKYYVFREMRKNFDVVSPTYINWKPFRMGVQGAGPDWYFASSNGNILVENLLNAPNGESNAYAATYVNGASGGTQTNPSVLEGPINQWFTDEIAYQVNSCYTCADGAMQWWVNGALVGQEPINMVWTNWTLTLRDSATGEDMTNMSIQGVADNDASFPDTNTFGLADIYVDNTWSRVMIGNASTWSQSTAHDIEIPTAWSGTSISVVLHNSSLPSFSNAYLYVFDSNGNVNQAGYPLCSSCPQTVSNLTVR